MKIKHATKQLAKYLTYILSRRPDEFGLVLDKNGFVRIKELLKALHEEDGLRFVRRANIDEVVNQEPNAAFEIKGQLIRATRRDHLPQRIPASHPPKLLFTCVRERAYAHVLEKGIAPTGFEQVILSSNRKLAQRMGRRFDQRPVLLTVQVQQSMQRGIVFYQAGEAIFLAESIPATCFTGPPLPKEKNPAPKTTPTVEKKRSATPGSFILGDLKKPEAGKQPRQGKRKKEIAWKRERRRRNRSHHS